MAPKSYIEILMSKISNPQAISNFKISNSISNQHQLQLKRMHNTCLRQSTCDGDKTVLITEKITRHTCARACYQILFVQMSKVWKLKRVYE